MVGVDDTMCAKPIQKDQATHGQRLSLVKVQDVLRTLRVLQKNAVVFSTFMRSYDKCESYSEKGDVRQKRTWLSILSRDLK